MREIFKYKTKNILYSTGTFEEDDEDKEKRLAAEAAMNTAAPAPSADEDSEFSGLTPEEMAIVNASKSDNRISDSVADIVAHNT
ncbi:MAG: hypothetical protein J6I62_09175 [Selenomonadaceae bacterium]|nr:hypothetical protein [Selenomonadaceae bacterium]